MDQAAYQRLNVSNVDDPDTSRISFVSEVHLLPRLLQRDCVDPLVIPRIAYVVLQRVNTCRSVSIARTTYKMVVNARIAAPAGLIFEWQTTNVSPIVVRPEKSLYRSQERTHEDEGCEA